MPPKKEVAQILILALNRLRVEDYSEEVSCEDWP